ncbi:secoisolariciresinol dehydrogenase-like protein [Tanacetum coccineum]
MDGVDVLSVVLYRLQADESTSSSSTPIYSPGALRNAECSNCKHLLDKITVLEAILKNKVAIVTGRAQGIGECIVRLFVKHGAKVVIADVNDDLGELVCRDLCSEFASFVHCDVTIESDIENVINTTIAKHGQLDIMVNNAGTIDEPKLITGGVGTHANTSSEAFVGGGIKQRNAGKSAELEKYNYSCEFDESGNLMHTLDVIMSMGDHASDMDIKWYCAYLCCCTLMFLGMTYMEVSREGYLEDAAERNSMEYAYYTPLA